MNFAIKFIFYKKIPRGFKKTKLLYSNTKTSTDQNWWGKINQYVQRETEANAASAAGVSEDGYCLLSAKTIFGLLSPSCPWAPSDQLCHQVRHPLHSVKERIGTFWHDCLGKVISQVWDKKINKCKKWSFSSNIINLSLFNVEFRNVESTLFM